MAERDRQGNLLYFDTVLVTFIFPDKFRIIIEKFKEIQNTS